jgi:hypothetical protein
LYITRIKDINNNYNIKLTRKRYIPREKTYKLIQKEYSERLNKIEASMDKIQTSIDTVLARSNEIVTLIDNFNKLILSRSTASQTRQSQAASQTATQAERSSTKSELRSNDKVANDLAINSIKKIDKIPLISGLNTIDTSLLQKFIKNKQIELD